MRFHWLRMRATAHPTEDPERVAAAMATILAHEGDDGPEVDAEPITTQHGAQAHLLTVDLTRNRDIRDAARRLVPADVDLDTRMDDEGTVYLRYGKQDAAKGTATPSAGDDTIQVRIRIQAHPVNRENAARAWAEFLRPT